MALSSFLAPTVADIGEHALIERIRTRLTIQPAWMVVGPGDDAAVVTPARGVLEVFTTDALVDGVHFDLRFVPATAVGHRALAVNLSDLAAMGAAPRAALLSLALPSGLSLADFDAMVEGFVRLADEHQVAIIGGNITRIDGPLVVDVTAIGTVRPRRIVRRTGARPGDAVYVTGRLGDAAVGLRQLADATAARGATDALSSDDTVERYLRPAPRLRAGLLLGRNRIPTSGMDLSDGLADGLRQLAQASDVGISIEADALPIGDTARAWCAQHGHDPVELALHGGDDYELLFTVRRGAARRLAAVRRLLGELPITRIGVVTRAPDLLVQDARGARPIGRGFEHFS